MKAYYKIGEISKIYGIGKDSLMYYEELGILNPVRGENSYRFYSISDIWRLNLIKELRSLDFSMKKIKAYLEDRDLNATQAILNEEVMLIDQKISELLRHKQNINSRLKEINEVIKKTPFHTIEIKKIKERKALLLNANITRDEQVDFLIQKLHKEYEASFYILGNHNIGAIFDFDEIKKGYYNVFQSVFCLLPDDARQFNFILPQGNYVSYHYTGAYKENKIYLEKMFTFVREQGYEIIGSPLEIYKLDIHETGKEEEFVTEIQIPIRFNQ